MGLGNTEDKGVVITVVVVVASSEYTSPFTTVTGVVVSVLSINEYSTSFSVTGCGLTTASGGERTLCVVTSYALSAATVRWCGMGDLGTGEA